jgi:hypothetical protein
MAPQNVMIWYPRGDQAADAGVAVVFVEQLDALVPYPGFGLEGVGTVPAGPAHPVHDVVV